MIHRDATRELVGAYWSLERLPYHATFESDSPENTKYLEISRRFSTDIFVSFLNSRQQLGVIVRHVLN